MATILRPQKDTTLIKVYTDCFLMLTKHHFGSDEDEKEKPLRTFVISTYKELLKKFLGGRCAPNSGLNARFFQEVFQTVPALGWALLKPLLRCFLGKDSDEPMRKSSMTSNESVHQEDTKKAEGGSRSNHQRLQAIEMVGQLIKASNGSESATKALADNLGLMTTVMIRVIETTDSW